MADAVICLALAAVMLAMGVRSWMERGAPLNNAWLFASERERAAMDKRPIYRQSAIVFSLLGAMFLLLGLGMALRAGWLIGGAGVVAAATVAYAVASTVSIGKTKRGA